MLDRSYKWPPDYVGIYGWRQRRVFQIRSDPVLRVGVKEYYRSRPLEFICHWVETYDPRNAGSDLPAFIPFVLFPRQQKFVLFLHALLAAQENGLVEKTRDMGATWICCAFSVWVWLYYPGAAVGWGSRIVDLVDTVGDPDSIFEKMRIIIRRLPKFFLPAGFDEREHMTYMKIVNPETGATITGEGGDNIGRGGRKLIYFKDESAHYPRPEKIEAALGDNTRVQVDISSVNGIGNVFHRKRLAGVDWELGQPIAKGRTNVFVLDWRDHPAKDQEWYEGRRAKAEMEGLLPNFYQEVDRNYAASVEGVIIQPEWFDAAVDAHKILGLKEDGMWAAALDVADGGGDTNAIALRQGIVLKHVSEWGERDTGVTTRKAANACLPFAPLELQYDCVGIGAGVKAEANRLIEENLMPRGIQLVPWNAAASVLRPAERLIPDDEQSPRNEDFYYNLKAQAWWKVARRFEATWRVMNVSGYKARLDDIISVSSEIPLLRKLQKEMSQATISKDNARMKLLVDKTPNGTKSPNLADATVMCYWPVPQVQAADPVFGSYGTTG